MSNLNHQTKTREEEYEDDEEEAPSLCDLPLDSDEPDTISKPHHHRRSSSEYAFEFSNDYSSDHMSLAEDIIHHGMLLPYTLHHQFDDQILKSLSSEYDSSNFSRRSCDSLPTRSNSTDSGKQIRSSRSLSDQKKNLRRNWSLVMKSEASDSHRSSSRSEAAKPRWYGLMFGVVKPPPEMDLRDMKNRQIRRSRGSMVAGDGAPADRSDRRSSWGYDLLKVLSCKNYSGVAVTASIGLVPQI